MSRTAFHVVVFLVGLLAVCWIGIGYVSVHPLGAAVAAIIALIDPRVIVFGARLPADLAQRLIARVAFEPAPRRGVASPYPALLVGQVQAHATVLGAAMLPFKETLF